MSNRRKLAFETLRHRDFRLLWTADTVATLGAQIQNVAIAWQIFKLTDSPAALGQLGLFRFIPVLFFGLYGGVIADRRDRRMILILSHLALMATTAMLALATSQGSVSMPLIYGLTLLGASFNAFAGPARQSLVATLVPRSELTGATTLLNLAMQTAQIGGPAVGGVLIGTVGLASTYSIATIGFLAVVIAAYRMEARDVIVNTSQGGVTAVREGLAFLARTPMLLSVMALDFLATFFAASTTLMPIFADDVLDMGPDGFGLLLGAPGVGAVIGSLIMSVLPMPRKPGLGIVLAVLAYGACVMGFGLSTSIWLSLILLAGSGMADAVSMAMRHTIRNLVTPDEYRGRIAAAHTTFARGGPQLGEVESGYLASFVGVRSTVAIGGFLTIVGCALMVKLVPQLVRYTVDEMETEPPSGPLDRTAAKVS